MILTKKQVNVPFNIAVKSVEKATNSMTIPGQAMNLKLAMEQYKKGSLIERAKGFYEKEGFECPDFNMMTRIEKLQALSEYRNLTKTLAEKLDKSHEKANQKFNENVKHQESIQKERKAKPSGDSDSGSQPNAK